MPAPIINFSYSKNLLVVDFKDMSLNNPTSWLWDFGDGTTSTSQSPQRTYSAEGFYNVTLTATNTDGAETLTLTIGISSTIPSPLDQSIWFLIDAYIPDNLVTAMDPNEKRSLINKWQLYLLPLVLVTPAIADQDVHKELAYPPLVNQLIAELVAYDLIIQAANSFMTAMSNAGSSSSSTITTTGQQKKKIETGPTIVEWYQDKTAEDIGDIGAAFSSAIKHGGALDMIKQQVCQLAHRLRIYLPMCGQLAYSPVVPSKTVVTPTYPSEGNPFGIPKPYQ